MYLIYRPDEGDEQQWHFAPGKVPNVDAEAIERYTGWDYGTEFLQHLQKGSTLARRALLWVMLRRQHETRVKFEDLKFTHDQVELVYDRDELAQIREQIERQPFESEQIRLAALRAIDDDMATAPAPPGKAPASVDD